MSQVFDELRKVNTYCKRQRPIFGYGADERVWIHHDLCRNYRSCSSNECPAIARASRQVGARIVMTLKQNSCGCNLSFNSSDPQSGQPPSPPGNYLADALWWVCTVLTKSTKLN